MLVNILPPAASVVIAQRYESSFLGLEARQDYRVINLWEVEAELVFEQSLTALLPFVPILKQGGEVAVVQRALNQLRQDQQMVELESLPSEIVAQVQALDLEQLEALGEALLDFSALTNLLDWLASHRPNREQS